MEGAGRNMWCIVTGMRGVGELSFEGGLKFERI